MSTDKMILTRDGVRLSVREYGSSDAPNTYVFAHGWCLNKNSWNIQAEHLVEELGDAVRVITYDHRGHGASETPESRTYNLPQLARDLADLLRALEVSGNVTLSGHSMGGMTIMQYMALPADERPVEPDHIALVATSAGGLTEGGVGSALNKILPETGVRAVMKYAPRRVINPVMRSMSYPLTSVLIKAVGYTADHDKEIADMCVNAINQTPMHTILGFAMGIKHFDVRDDLKNIYTDVVIFSGGKDFLTPTDHSNLMEERIPSARRFHFEDCGHMVLHEAANDLNDVLRSFAYVPALALSV